MCAPTGVVAEESNNAAEPEFDAAQVPLVEDRAARQRRAVRAAQSRIEDGFRSDHTAVNPFLPPEEDAPLTLAQITGG
jgi:hypothetical protein